MDLRSYIQLKEAYVKMNLPQAEIVSEEVEVVEEEILDEALKGVDGKPLPVTDKDKAAVAKAKNDKAYADKAAEWKKNTGGTDYTAFKAGGGDTSKKATGMDAQRRARAGIQATQQKGRENLAKVGQRQGPPAPTGSSKPKGDLLSTLAKGGSKAAQDVKSKLPKSGSGGSTGSGGSSGSSGSSGSGGGSRPTGGGSSRPAPTPKPTPKPQSKDMGANMRSWSKANPNLAKKVKPAQSGYKAINPQSKPSTPAPSSSSSSSSIKSSRLNKALSDKSSLKFKAEETEMTEFDIILEYLVDQGFPVEEALVMMVNMSSEKQEQILEMRHRDAKTGEVTDKPVVGRTYYTDGPRAKSSVALRKEKEAAEKKKTQKEEVGSIEENRRAARSAGGYVDDSKKQTDPSKDGFTGISGSIKDIMRQNKEIEARNKKKTKKEEVESIEEMRHRDAETGEVTDKPVVGRTYYTDGPRQKSSVALRKEKEAAKKKQKTHKEEMASLYQAYLSMYTEEESDREKDKHLERGGHAARTDYTKPPKGTGPMSDEEKEKSRKASMSAVEKVKADMMAKYGKGAIMDTKKKED